MITEQVVKRAIGKLSLLKYFPSDEYARAALMELFGEICRTDEDVLWLSKRISETCTDWPGIPVLWQCWFSKHPPRDQRERELDRNSGATEMFPDGFPSEREKQPLQLPMPSAKALPAGHSASVDPELENTVAELAEARKMPPLKKYYARTVARPANL